MCCPEEHEPDLSGIETDPRFDLILAPWDGQEEDAVQDESGWHMFTPLAYPLEIISLLEMLIRRLQRERSDMVVIETGVGQGYTTRRLGPLMRPEHDLYWAFESDPDMRTQISLRDFWLEHLVCCIKEPLTPDPIEIQTADLVIIDSDYPWAYVEFYEWLGARRDGSLLVTSLRPHDPDISNDVSAFYAGNDKRDIWIYAEHDEIDFVFETWTSMFEHPSSGG